MNRSIHIAAVCVVAMTLLPGCGAMFAMLSPKPGDEAMVKEANEKKDLAKLTEYCSSKFRKDNGKALYYTAKSMACKMKKALGRDLAVAAIDGADCKNIKAMWIEHKDALKQAGRRTMGVPDKNSALTKSFNKVAVKLGQCGDYDYVFQEMIHWGPHVVGAQGRLGLEAMDKANLPVEKEYLKWMGSKTSNPYTPKIAMYALEHYLNWRLAKGGDIDCKPYVKVWSKFTHPQHMSWIYVFYRGTKCKEAADWVMKGLKTSRAKTRHRACKTLGIIGNKSHTKQMSILAKSDGAYKIVRYNKVYWVRDMCRQAVGQINMR